MVESDTKAVSSSEQTTGLLSEKKQPFNTGRASTRGIEIVKKGYALFINDCDIDSIMDLFSEDAIIECYSSDDVPLTGTGRSKEYIKNNYFGKSLQTYDFKEFNYDQFEYFVGISGADQRPTVHTFTLGKGYLKNEDKRPFVVHSAHTFLFNENWKIERFHEVCSISYTKWQ